MTQIILNNTNQLKICSYLENLDGKVNLLLEMDKRSRVVAFPLPRLPTPCIDLLPISTVDSLDAVEKLLKIQDSIRNQDELVSLKKIFVL